MSNSSHDYYTYVYELMLEHVYPTDIPVESLLDVLAYFESVEDYEKCEILKRIIETHK